MAGKQPDGDGLPANFVGMSKNQLYEIMSQMKTLIDQNPDQARQILVQNPALTKALFQAQIMLGMVKPPQAVPNIQPTASQLQPPTESLQPVQQAHIQASPALPGQNGLQDQTSASQAPVPIRKQHKTPLMPILSTSPPLNLPSQSLSSHGLQSAQQPKGHISSQALPVSLSQSSQVLSIPPPPLHSVSQPPPLQPPMPVGSTQLQQPSQTSGMQHLALQPPLPPQPRPPFSHQLHSQMGPNMGFQQSGAPQLHHSQPMFHAGMKPPLGMGPSFPQGQQPLPSQPPIRSLYQVGGSHLGSEFSHAESSMPPDRGPAWIPGLQDNAMGTHMPGPPPLAPPPMGPGNQPAHAASLTPEMEKALLQQVMSLTPEQINLLPPEQRHQVLQLQQMLRR
ncbi:cleavage stimulating factor 64-like [Diospyros lotus]|uniref:cleavage stimulating factor 64-like n=1 Tax=Diospyros lotus TaxID=55363 RepID=UPI00224D7E0C|nr:cleavage stimulating factor 64-like [Diospyros lotus]XP_052179577.1 cleavage stimulating factor 64-like [Diospyros lotus]XP_052179578.1 cleavage stimulating factor 64-like [Diospyros lotus]